MKNTSNAPEEEASLLPLRPCCFSCPRHLVLQSVLMFIEFSTRAMEGMVNRANGGLTAQQNQQNRQVKACVVVGSLSDGNNG